MFIKNKYSTYTVIIQYKYSIVQYSIGTVKYSISTVIVQYKYNTVQVQ